MASHRSFTWAGIVLIHTLVTILGSSVDHKRFLLQSQQTTCTFEAGICGYTQDQTDDFDWTIRYHSTPTRETGPRVDHTLGQRNIQTGHYMYTEASTPRHGGDVARLISPPFQTGSQQHHVTFWYYMWGVDMGLLKLYLKHGSNMGKSVFSEEGDRGEEWMQGCVDIPLNMTEVQAVFEGIRGDGATSDVAIDDVTFAPGQCPVIPLWPASCDFEDNMCAYHQDRYDDANWIRHRGGTSTPGTGPSGDHTTGNGYYMYLESSDAGTGDEARLYSPEFDSIGRQLSVNFWYEDHGRSVGAFNVYLRVGDDMGKPYFVSTGDVAGWHEGCINIPEGLVDVRVVFEAVRGQYVYGDIAVDDVALTYGYCHHTVSPGISGSTATPHVAARWSAWSGFGACSSTCGHGIMARTRRCIGTGCVGASKQYSTCNHSPCTTNAQWGAWSGYSACSVTCGHGLRTSHRTCHLPSSSGGSHSCAGTATRVIHCSVSTACTVNGGWASWSTWSQCSKSCDMGTITRHRTCTHPAPSGGGSQCTGGDTETHDCSNGPCAAWSHWYNSPCSSSCGNGTMERLRHCSTGHDEDCVGNSYEQVPCTNAGCVDK